MTTSRINQEYRRHFPSELGHRGKVSLGDHAQRFDRTTREHRSTGERLAMQFSVQIVVR